MNEEQMDRFARGELSPAESRALARQALDDADLFEELTVTAIAKTELQNRARRRNVRPIYALLAAAAAIALAVWVHGLGSRPAPPTAITAEALVFLPHATDTNAVFRGDEPESRAPRATGAVTSVDGDGIGIDLGSLDGLAKGEEVGVFRDGKRTGALKVSAVFREHARAEASAGLEVRANDEVRVTPAMSLRAALDQIAASMALGDSAGAWRLAQQAAAAGPADIRVSGYEDLNNLGDILALQGERAKAQSFYQQALATNPPQETRRAIESNLARVSDRSKP
jgi:tetratricopeptide (TPR) repeat protein